jgi:hypothetical protein
VITPDQRESADHGDAAVRELRARLHLDASPAHQLQPRVEADLAERHDDLHAWQRRGLCVEMIETACDLFRQRLVVGWRAAHRHRHERVAQLQAIVRVCRCGEVRESGAIQRRHEEVARTAGAVACEHTSRAIGAVRSRRQPDQQQPRIGIAEARHRTSPVLIGAVRALLLASDSTAVLAQTRATLT